MQTPYCEHDSLFLVLNAPWVFKVIFAIMKVILSKRQSSKVYLLGDTSTKEVKDKLSNLIPIDLLPQRYGGNKVILPGAWPIRDRLEDIAKWREERKNFLVSDQPLGLPIQKKEVGSVDSKSAPSDVADTLASTKQAETAILAETPALESSNTDTLPSTKQAETAILAETPALESSNTLVAQSVLERDKRREPTQRSDIVEAGSINIRHNKSLCCGLIGHSRSR